MNVIVRADRALVRTTRLREGIRGGAIAACPLRVARATSFVLVPSPFVLSLSKHFVCEDSLT
jgi:hypothetical protein